LTGRNNFGDTALELAPSNNNVSLVAMLATLAMLVMGKHVDLTRRNRTGESVILMASEIEGINPSIVDSLTTFVISKSNRLRKQRRTNAY
jgi:ankyrin repeat protein